jgi:manganese/zinc/iron transport system substrate-binding protein
VAYFGGMKICLAVCGGLLVLLGVGCQNQREESDGRPLVVATVTMVRDLVIEVGGERVRVEGLMGPGVDPHTYKPRPRDSGLLEVADAVFYSGLHLEGKMQESLEQLAGRRSGIHAVTDGIPKELLLEPQEDFEGHHDPHVWGDPELWKETIKMVVAGLSEMDPEGAEEYAKRGALYEERLMELKQWALTRVAEVPEDKRLLVTSHDAFFYFGRGFGFEVRGLQGVSTVSEAGLKDRAELVKFIREKGIRTIFPETSVNPKAIAAVAAEAGVTASKAELFSDAMGMAGDVETAGGESYDKGTYVGMVKHNVNSIVEGLK